MSIHLRSQRRRRSSSDWPSAGRITRRCSGSGPRVSSLVSESGSGAARAADRHYVVPPMYLVRCDADDSASRKLAEASKMSPKSHIPRAQLQQMFDGIRRQTKWNIDGDMLWGYFFADAQTDRLKLAQRQLEAQGYRFVDLYETERDGQPSGVFMLHLEKVETHTV